MIPVVACQSLLWTSLAPSFILIKIYTNLSLAYLQTMQSQDIFPALSEDDLLLLHTRLAQDEAGSRNRHRRGLQQEAAYVRQLQA